MNLNLEDISPEMMTAVWVMLGVRVLVWAFYANSVRKLLLEIAEANRFVRPAQAWLLVVPFLNIYWNFVVARSISNSLNNEFFDRKIAEEPSPGLAKGMLYAWMFLLANIPFPAFIMVTFFILSVVYFIQYWIKISNFRNLIIEHKRFSADQPDAHKDLG